MLKWIMAKLGISGIIWAVSALVLTGGVAAAIWLFRDWEDRGLEVARLNAQHDRLVTEFALDEDADARQIEQLNVDLIMARAVSARRVAAHEVLAENLRALDGVPADDATCAMPLAIDFALDRMLDVP